MVCSDFFCILKFLSTRISSFKTFVFCQLDIDQNNVLIQLGIASIVLGFSIMVCGICAVAIFGSLDYNEASSGIWGGVFIIVAGSISVASAYRASNRTLNTLNIAFHIFAMCCIIAALALFGLTIE